MILTTDRLTLRPLGLADLPAMTALLQDPLVHPWVREDGAPDEPQVKRWIARKMLAWAQGTEAAWAVVHEEAPVGYVTVHALDRPIQSVSYAVAPSHRRQGIAREALTAVLDAHDALGVREMVARTHQENPASAALLEQLGFEERAPLLRPVRREFVRRFDA